jgi:hypothetical protein
VIKNHKMKLFLNILFLIYSTLSFSQNGKINELLNDVINNIKSSEKIYKYVNSKTLISMMIRFLIYHINLIKKHKQKN